MHLLGHDMMDDIDATIDLHPSFLRDYKIDDECIEVPCVPHHFDTNAKVERTRGIT